MSNQEKGQLTINLEITGLAEFKKQVEAASKQLVVSLEKSKVSISQAITKF